jgi:hypothetical protein
MGKNRRQTRKKRTKQSRCTSFVGPSVGPFLQQLLTDSMRCTVGQVISIDMLPDDVVLAIFDFVVARKLMKKEIEPWQTLVHVCQRWRSVVFGSPRRLNLRLVCTAKTPAGDTLDVWPTLPLIIQNRDGLTVGVNNIIAALERRDPVVKIELTHVNSSSLEKVLAAMHVPFPELTDLRLWSDDETVPALPDSFLGRSAPRLEYLLLYGIPFPGLPKLLLSATNLVKLILNIPHSGYISPEVVVTALSTLPSLKSLRLQFQSPLSYPDLASRRPPPKTRTVLPILSHFSFKGVYEYLDDLVARIDAPRLDELSITFFHDTVFDTPQFIQFIGRTPMLKALETAIITFEDNAAVIYFQTSAYKSLEVKISCRKLDWQVSSLEQVCTSCLPPLSTLEKLSIHLTPSSHSHGQDNIENTLWVELLHPFTAVKGLFLSEEFVPHIAPALKELVGGRATAVLPTLQNISLMAPPSGPVDEGIQQFVAMRQATGHPIEVSYGDDEEVEDSDSYELYEVDE